MKEKMGILREQISKLYRLDFYRKKMDQAGIKPSRIKTQNDFERIPFTSSSEILEELKKRPKDSSLFTKDVVRVNFSPSGQDLYPVYQTRKDLKKMHEVCARTLRAAGVRKDDICAITYGYHLFIAGLFYQSQLEYYGAKVIPLGPGDSERAVHLINKYDVSVLITNPTFALTCAGIIIGVINLTGLGLKFTSLILFIAGNSLPPALIFTMLAGIILGMGLPTTAAYIVQAALLIPALIKLGVPTIAAHLFVFYFAIISAITPPVAMAVYAAAGISGSNLWRTGLQAVRIGATGFIIPYMFVYGPSLLMIGSTWTILTALLSACLGVIALSAGLMGWLFKGTSLIERGMLIVGAILLINPGLLTDGIGLALFMAVVIIQKLKK